MTAASEREEQARLELVGEITRLERMCWSQPRLPQDMTLRRQEALVNQKILMLMEASRKVGGQE